MNLLVLDEQQKKKELVETKFEIAMCPAKIVPSHESIQTSTTP